MASSLLVPVHVSAKVLAVSVEVPRLSGAPFENEDTLGRGIHVHWALPDFLTRARLDKDAGGALFPGVPDLWLVTRFNPGTAQARTWRAWVVDSRNETVRPQPEWQLEEGRDAATIHTVPGMLKSAEEFGWPGWGFLPGSDGAFDPAMAAYYPACRQRFGFHDRLEDLGGASGKVTYSVMGWYANPDHDPLYRSKNRADLLAYWKLTTKPPSKFGKELFTKFDSGVLAAATAWQPASMSTTPIQASAARVSAATAALATTLTGQSHQASVAAMKVSFGVEAATASGVAISEAVAANLPKEPSKINCHGSVVDVPLSGFAGLPPTIQDKDVLLFPSIKRALADIAARTGTESDKDAVEALLQGVDGQKGTFGGVLDYPGAIHALAFQSAPGKSRFHARIDIRPPLLEVGPPKFFGTAGHFPEIRARSAKASQLAVQAMIPAPVLSQPAPQKPTPAEIAAWIADVRAKFAAAVAATAATTPIDERMLLVQDHRPNSKSPQDGFWVDIEDDKALGEVRVSAQGARVHLPDADNIFEVPGPRWYRPWSPQLVVYSVDRSYKFGADGRFRKDGLLQCRVTGDTVTGLVVGGNARVNGRSIIQRGETLLRPGIPGEARALLEETLLLDTGSAPAMAADALREASQQNVALYSNAVKGLWIRRDSSLNAAEVAAIDKVKPVGEMPSPIAVTPWRDPRDPLFIDVNYAHPRRPIERDWDLLPDAVEMTPKVVDPAAPPPPPEEVFDERSYVTATVAKVLDNTLVKSFALDAYGHPVKHNPSPKGVDESTFVKMDVISAPLAKFDEGLLGRGVRERAGSLRLNRFELVDMFGLRRSWTAPAGTQHTIDLTPRLPHWSRLQFRFQSAADPTVEATPINPAVCGLLLPDFMEHALEVYDSNGRAIGQLSADRGRFGSSGAVTLEVRFEAHPWVAAELGLPDGADPVTAISNPTLRSVVEGIRAQSLDVPAGQDSSIWFETGMTGLMRVVDTVRATLDPSVKTPDGKIHLIGQPIAVLAARVSIEATAAAPPGTKTQSPPPLAIPPPTPSVKVRIGDVTRPDDAVLGVFLPGATPADSRFAPVALEAASKAILNAFVAGAHGGRAVTHPFVAGLVSEFQLNPSGDARDLVILADLRGGLYATCGVLPRKKISIPREFLDAALRNIEPTLTVGPLLGNVTGGAVKAMIPPPKLEGFNATFVRADAGSFPSTPITPVAPVAELPNGRVRLTDGWIRFKPAKK